MVKPLHPIHEIAARLSEAASNSVPLIRSSVVDGAHVDPTEATLAALAAPVDYPPLSAGFVPGDHVAIVLDETTPCVGEIVRGAIQSFVSTGVEQDAITVVASDASAIKSCRDSCSGEHLNGVKFVVHDPDDERNLCMVGMTKGGVKLVVNREIFDADVVLPIGCARPNDRGAYHSLFPRFSNTESINRYRTPTFLESAKEQAEQRRETNQAGWLIGVPMVIEVVPGSGETVAQVIAGEPAKAAEESSKVARARWSLKSPQQVDLLITTIGGGAETQNWTNVGRALAMAEHLVVDGGAVAICSNLNDRLGPSLGRLVGNPDLERVTKKLAHEHHADSWTAWQLARALQRGHVYFLSQLDDDTAEDLGLAPVGSIEEIVRLAERRESYLLVEDVQNALVTLAKRRDDS